MFAIRKCWVSLLIFVCSISGFAQTRNVINIPDIPGYATLKCDFHTHTIFSDGDVWPTIRVDEAWAEGLDALAISDHIEYHKYKDDIPVNLERSFEAAKDRAEALNIILIKAAEITRDMPPGHFNALFVHDINKLDVKTWRDALKAAHDQGAYVFWNHPGWRQPNEIPIWYDEHTEILEKGWVQGLEIVNEKSYYPLALTWGLERNLTLMGNSDIHGLISLVYQQELGGHRPMTLVFVTEKSADGIKTALFEHRTAVFFNGTYYGKPVFLEPLFQESIKVENPVVHVLNQGAAALEIENQSDVPLKLVKADEVDGVDFPGNIVLEPHRATVLALRLHSKDSGTYKLPYTVENMVVAPDQGLSITIEFSTEK